jgi:hypothetical protein
MTPYSHLFLVLVRSRAILFEERGVPGMDAEDTDVHGTDAAGTDAAGTK